MPRSKIETYLGFAIRAGKVLWGLDALLKAKREPYAVLYDATVGAASMRKLEKYLASHTSVKRFVCEMKISDLVKRDNCKIIAVTDEELGKAIINTTSNTAFGGACIE